MRDGGDGPARDRDAPHAPSAPATPAAGAARRSDGRGAYSESSSSASPSRSSSSEEDSDTGTRPPSPPEDGWEEDAEEGEEGSEDGTAGDETEGGTDDAGASTAESEAAESEAAESDGGGHAGPETLEAGSSAADMERHVAELIVARAEQAAEIEDCRALISQLEQEREQLRAAVAHEREERRVLIERGREGEQQRLDLQRQVQQQEVEAAAYLDKLAETQHQLRHVTTQRDEALAELNALRTESAGDKGAGGAGATGQHHARTGAGAATTDSPPSPSMCALSWVGLRPPFASTQSACLPAPLDGGRVGQDAAGAADVDQDAQDESSRRSIVPCTATQEIDVTEQEMDAAQQKTTDTEERGGERAGKEGLQGEREVAEKAREAREMELDEQVTLLQGALDQLQESICTFMSRHQNPRPTLSSPPPPLPPHLDRASVATIKSAEQRKEQAGGSAFARDTVFPHKPSTRTPRLSGASGKRNIHVDFDTTPHDIVQKNVDGECGVGNRDNGSQSTAVQRRSHPALAEVDSKRGGKSGAAPRQTLSGNFLTTNNSVDRVPSSAERSESQSTPSPSLTTSSPLSTPHKIENTRCRNEMSKSGIAGLVPSTLLGAPYREILSPSLGTEFEAAVEGLQLAIMGVLNPESVEESLFILRSEAQRLSAASALSQKQLEEANLQIESMQKREMRMQAKYFAMQSDLEVLQKLSHPIAVKKASREAAGLWEHGRERGIAMYNGSRKGERYLESTKGVDDERAKVLLKKCAALQQQVEELQQLQQLTVSQEQELEILRQLLEDREIQMKAKDVEKGRELAAERERRQTLEQEWQKEREDREREEFEREVEREENMQRQRAEWAEREKRIEQQLLYAQSELDQERERRKTRNEERDLTQTGADLPKDCKHDDEVTGIDAEVHNSSTQLLKVPTIPLPPGKSSASAHRRPSPRTYQVAGVAPASGHVQGAEVAALQKTLEMKETELQRRENEIMLLEHKLTLAQEISGQDEWKGGRDSTADESEVEQRCRELQAELALKDKRVSELQRLVETQEAEKVRIHDTRVEKREGMDTLGGGAPVEEEWELEVNSLRSQICVLKERYCMAENKYTTAKVQLQALQSQLETYRELGFSSVAPSPPRPEVCVPAPPPPQSELVLESLRSQIREREHDLRSLQSTTAERVKKLEVQLAHLKSQQDEKEAYHQDTVERIRASHRAECEQTEQLMEASKKNVEKEKAIAARWQKRSGSLALKLHKISTRGKQALVFCAWLQQKRRAEAERKSEKAAQRSLKELEQGYKSAIVEMKKEHEQVSQTLEKKVRAALLSAQAESKSSSKWKNVIEEKEQLLMEKERLLTEMEVEKQSLVSQIQTLKQTQVGRDQNIERTRASLEAREDERREDSETCRRSPQGCQEAMREGTPGGEEFNAAGARTSGEVWEGVGADDEAAALLDLSCRSMAVQLDSPGPGEARARALVDGLRRENARDSLESVARTGMVDALFAASAKVEELEIQLAATHDSNRELHLEIESLNALLQQGLEGAGAGAGSVADNRTHERRLSPASKNASTPASRRERVTLPSDSTRDSSTISNASEVKAGRMASCASEEARQQGGLPTLRMNLSRLLEERGRFMEKERAIEKCETGATSGKGEQKAGSGGGRGEGDTPAAKSARTPLRPKGANAAITPIPKGAARNASLSDKNKETLRLPSMRGAAGIVAKSLGDMKNIVNTLRSEMADKQCELEKSREELQGMSDQLERALGELQQKNTEFTLIKSEVQASVAAASRAAYEDTRKLIVEVSALLEEAMNVVATCGQHSLSETSKQVAYGSHEASEGKNQQIVQDLYLEIEKRDLEIQDQNTKIATLQELIDVVKSRDLELEKRDMEIDDRNLEIKEKSLEIQKLKDRLQMACDTSIASLRESKRVTDIKTQEIRHLSQLVDSLRADNETQEEKFRDESERMQAQILDAVGSINQLQHHQQRLQDQLLLKEQEIASLSIALAELKPLEEQVGALGDGAERLENADASTMEMLWQTRCDMLQQDKANLESTVSMLRQQLRTVTDQSASGDAE